MKNDRKISRTSFLPNEEGAASAGTAFRNGASSLEKTCQIVVLGMHRSGTSVLTDALDRMGVFVGEQGDLTAANWENPQGFFERRDARRICNELLHSVGADWWKVARFDARQVGFPALGEGRKAIKALVEKLDAQGHWALKEPRLCVLLPVFLPFLRNAMPIMALRHPIEVAFSLHHRNGFPIQAALALWEAYIVRALRDSEGIERCFVHYSALVDDPVDTLRPLTQRLEELGLGGLDPVRGSAAIDPSLFRERQNDEQNWRLSPEQMRLWEMLQGVGVDGAGLEVPKPSPHATEILEEFEIAHSAQMNLLAAKDERDELKGAAAGANKQLENARNERDAVAGELAAAQTQLDVAAGELAAAQTQLDVAAGERAAVQAQLDTVAGELAATQAQLERSRDAESGLAANLELTQIALSMREEKCSRLSRDIARVNATRDALKGELAAQRRLAERQARSHQDALRRGMERATEEVRTFVKARHKAANHITDLEWNLRLATRETAAAKTERVAREARLEAILRSRSWRILAFSRQIAHKSIGRVLHRRQLPHGISMHAVESLFDQAWYSTRNPDAASSGLQPLDHYLAYGASLGSDPGPLFDVRYYLAAADALGQREEAAKNPLLHYLAEGAAAGLSPHVLLDPGFYAAENPDVVESGMNLLVHFIRHGAGEGRAPSAYFNIRWYLDKNEDVAAAGCNPLLHYLDHGADEGRDPSPDFSTRGYLRSYPDVLRSLQNPLVHYALFGRLEGRNPKGLGDPTAPPAIGIAARSSTHRPSRPAKATEPPPVVASTHKLPLNALVLSWDIGHNPVGRAYMLAEAIDRAVEHTVIAGFQFPRYGTRVWEPLRESRLPVIRMPGHNLPEMIECVRKIADQVRPDVVIACKPRLPSLQLGMHIRDAANCPLILDIDDHELSFFSNREPIALDQLKEVEPGSWASNVEPYGEEWTRLCEGMTDVADRILVSNTALQKRFGGVVVPHVRDELAFSPVEPARRAAARAAYGVPVDARVVLFFGTPRLHKGVGALAEAVAAIDDARMRLVIVGDAPDRSITARLDQIAPGRVIRIPGQPFSAIPGIMALGDIVALPQDIDHPVSQYQLPAKAIDAIAASLPLLVTPTPPLMDLVDAGLAIPFEPDRLKEAIAAAFESPPTSVSQAAARERFLRSYSYLSAGEKLREIIAKVTAQKPEGFSSGVSARLVHEQRRVMDCEPPSPVADIASIGRDIVIFWKQNDSTLYGRRNDMVARYLASREDVRRVIVFDAPISRDRLLDLRDRGRPGDQDRLIYGRTMEKCMGLRDEGKIAHRAMVYQPRQLRGKGPDALQDEMLVHVRETLKREGVDPAQAIFWLYPRNPFIEAIVETLKPARVVTDIVDDHRAWPNVSEEERKALDRHYANVLRIANFAMANCEPVRASMAEMRPDIRLIANGCDTPSAPETPSSPDFQRVAEWQGKIIGYTGNLEAKIDHGLIELLSQRLPDFLIVLVGSTHANPSVRELAKLPNVLMPGVVPYDELSAWVSRFDVAIIPHRRMALTEAMNPLKQYVYLTHGVPVVATNISGLEDAPGITIASDPEAFIAAVQTALDTPRRTTTAEDFIRDHGWASRLSSVVDEILAR